MEFMPQNCWASMTPMTTKVARLWCGCVRAWRMLIVEGLSVGVLSRDEWVASRRRAFSSSGCGSWCEYAVGGGDVGEGGDVPCSSREDSTPHAAISSETSLPWPRSRRKTFFASPGAPWSARYFGLSTESDRPSSCNKPKPPPTARMTRHSCPRLRK